MVFNDDKVINWVNKFDTAQEWRNARFWNLECEKVLKNKTNILKALFEYTSYINPKRTF